MLSYCFQVADSLEKGTEHEDEYMISEKELLVNRFVELLFWTHRFSFPYKSKTMGSIMFDQVYLRAQRHGSIQLWSFCCRDCKGGSSLKYPSQTCLVGWTMNAWTLSRISCRAYWTMLAFPRWWRRILCQLKASRGPGQRSWLNLLKR